MANSNQTRGLGASWRTNTMLISAMALIFPLLAGAQNGPVEKALYQGNQAMRGGQWDVAASCFSRVITVAPTFAEAHFNLGLARLQQGRWNDAIPSFEKSLALKPHLRGANLFLGIAR